MPIEDRAADTWEPLIAVADLAGGDWPERARNAAKAMTGEAAEDEATASLARRLLSDLRTVFGEADKMHGQDILTALHAIEDAPWGDFFGRPFTANDLSKLLRPYNVKPRDVKIKDVNKKGYYRADLWETWTCYLPSVPDPCQDPATPATPATSQVNGVPPVAGSAFKPLPATGSVPVTSAVALVAGVAAPGQYLAHEAGPCNRCGTTIHRYGAGGTPLCAECTSQLAQAA
jgi:hypothetical protein